MLNYNTSYCVYYFWPVATAVEVDVVTVARLADWLRTPHCTQVWRLIYAEL
jgi:hypothetical protein